MDRGSAAPRAARLARCAAYGEHMVFRTRCSALCGQRRRAGTTHPPFHDRGQPCGTMAGAADRRQSRERRGGIPFLRPTAGRSERQSESRHIGSQSRHFPVPGLACRTADRSIGRPVAGENAGIALRPFHRQRRLRIAESCWTSPRRTPPRLAASSRLVARPSIWAATGRRSASLQVRNDRAASLTRNNISDRINRRPWLRAAISRNHPSREHLAHEEGIAL